MTKAPDAMSGAFCLTLWPHRSLPLHGFAAFIAITSALFLLPLMTALGTPVLWGLLPFPVLAICGMWLALRRSYRDARVIEKLILAPGKLTLSRRDKSGLRRWEADPYWTRAMLREDGPVPNYLTLESGDRKAEIGSFLSEPERIALHSELSQRLRQACR